MVVVVALSAWVVVDFVMSTRQGSFWCLGLSREESFICGTEELDVLYVRMDVFLPPSVTSSCNGRHKNLPPP